VGRGRQAVDVLKPPRLPGDLDVIALGGAVGGDDGDLDAEEGAGGRDGGDDADVGGAGPRAVGVLDGDQVPLKLTELLTTTQTS
jgi:hypothetical protein